ncbi:MAG: hypothetical protein NTZ13_02350 [Candidatus Parcubacteria bacterium]|nr:hypothetical protein [Candidatus Parcubacteria bacterium]
MIIPYVGITDFMTFEQVQQMLAVFKSNLAPSQNRRLHVGVMMSYKTLHNLETRWTKAFPKKENIADIFSSSETMNCLHYADYEAIDVQCSIAKAISYGGNGINALQLDMIWPNPDYIAKAVFASGVNLEVILQIGKNAIEEANDDPKEVVKRLSGYKDIVQYVLLDKSMGQGLGMDATGLIPFAKAVKEAFPEISIVAAGGLGPESVGLVKPLVLEFPDISIDAQGKLRQSGNALDPIDWNMAEMYLIKALALLK